MSHSKTPSSIPQPANHVREKANAQIHRLFVHQDTAACLKLIDAELARCNGLSEYPLYLKGVIKRQQGKVEESLQLFQAATFLNPTNVSNVKQTARSLYLLGRIDEALDLYSAAEALSPRLDWEILYAKGLCHVRMGDHVSAVAAFKEANSVHRTDVTYIEMAKSYLALNDLPSALRVYTDGIEQSNENTELLTGLGLLFLKMNDPQKAFDMLGTSLAHDPKMPKTVLAAASIIQDHQSYDVALVKYRIVAAQTVDSAELWCNVGMCLFSKQRYIAAISCLKRALYLDPFAHLAAHNLGLVYLQTGQYASAFNCLSSAINLKPDNASSYAYLAVALAKMEDYANAATAYEKALSLNPSDPLTYLNYAVALAKAKSPALGDKAKELFQTFQRLWAELDKSAQSEINAGLTIQALNAALAAMSPSSPSSASSASSATSASTSTSSATAPPPVPPPPPPPVPPKPSTLS